MIINPDECSYMCFDKNSNNDDTSNFNLQNSKKETVLEKLTKNLLQRAILKLENCAHF